MPGDLPRAGLPSRVGIWSGRVRIRAFDGTGGRPCGVVPWFDPGLLEIASSLRRLDAAFHGTRAARTMRSAERAAGSQTSKSEVPAMIG